MNVQRSRIVTSICCVMLVFALATPIHAAAREITPASVLQVVNETRTQNGLSHVHMNEALNRAALNKANDMQIYEYWAHTNPVTHTTGWSFIRQSGYAYTSAGENLAKDYTSITGVLQGWLASPTHRNVLLSDKYSETGIGVVYYTIHGVEKALVVQLFASPYKTTASVPSSLSLAFGKLLATIRL